MARAEWSGRPGRGRRTERPRRRSGRVEGKPLTMGPGCLGKFLKGQPRPPGQGHVAWLVDPDAIQPLGAQDEIGDACDASASQPGAGASRSNAPSVFRGCPKDGCRLLRAVRKSNCPRGVTVEGPVLDFGAGDNLNVLR
jgi:hypothetical protein